MAMIYLVSLNLIWMLVLFILLQVMGLQRQAGILDLYMSRQHDSHQVYSCSKWHGDSLDSTETCGDYPQHIATTVSKTSHDGKVIGVA